RASHVLECGSARRPLVAFRTAQSPRAQYPKEHARAAIQSSLIAQLTRSRYARAHVWKGEYEPPTDEGSVFRRQRAQRILAAHWAGNRGHFLEYGKSTGRDHRPSGGVDR